MHYCTINNRSHHIDDLRNQFTKLFVSVFSGSPFYEAFTVKEAEAVFQTYINPKALFIGAFDGTKLVGYGASLPVSQTSADMINILSDYIDINQAIYNADLAVYPEFRNQGIGSRLIHMRNEYAAANGFQTIVMRTNAKGSMSAPLYERLGFKVLPQTMRVHQKRVRNNVPEHEDRILLIGQTRTLNLAA